ncbi:hypothetical protein AAH994_15505, partial [Weeksellaceae bacterium A-14]
PHFANTFSVSRNFKQMERINTEEIKSWIAPYLTVNGNTPEVPIILKETNILKYFQELTLPNIFEEYAIILHSFWIYNLTENQIERLNLKGKELINSEPEFPENGYNPISWFDFYKFKKVDFDLKTAIKNSVDWKFPFVQMNNELYPGEGIIDNKHLSEISNLILKYYGDQEIEIYYIFLATNNWEEDKMFKGKITELIKLIENEETVRTPSLIYSTEKNWALNSDYDLQFSIIGGNKEFINELIEKNPKEIYQIS